MRDSEEDDGDCGGTDSWRIWRRWIRDSCLRHFEDLPIKIMMRFSGSYYRIRMEEEKTRNEKKGKKYFVLSFAEVDG